MDLTQQQPHVRVSVRVHFQHVAEYTTAGNSSKYAKAIGGEKLAVTATQVTESNQ